MKNAESAGIARGRGRYLGSVVYDCSRFVGGGARRVAVQLLHRQGRWLRGGNGQLGFRIGRLLHQEPNQAVEAVRF